jgi:hypothetical protein
MDDPIVTDVQTVVETAIKAGETDSTLAARTDNPAEKLVSREIMLEKAVKCMGKLADTARGRDGRITGRMTLSTDATETRLFKKYFPTFPLAEILASALRASAVGAVSMSGSGYTVLSVYAAESLRAAIKARTNSSRAALHRHTLGDVTATNSTGGKALKTSCTKLQPARYRYACSPDWIYKPSLSIAMVGAKAAAKALAKHGDPCDVTVECLETGQSWVVAPTGEIMEAE